MPYHFCEIEKKTQAYWEKNQVHKTIEKSNKAKCYILDMFPYPSGYTLHLGHLLSYFPSDALAIFFRLRGYNVLHPIGFDAFGLPAEQHAIDTGQHPADTIKKNSAVYKKTLKDVGLTFDWSRSFSTTDPTYYRWTQWIFIQLFESWYDHEQDRARPIADLEKKIATEGNEKIKVYGKNPPIITSKEWASSSLERRKEILAYYRLAYLSDTTVNWCPELGTVLANDEVKDGFSERGGHPVVKKKMRQWHLRILPYADRLLEGLKEVKWPSATKDMQRNWIGKSQGAQITFFIEGEKLPPLTIFTTKPETLFGVSYLALAPEHPILPKIVQYLKEQGSALDKPYRAVKNYISIAQQRSERKRMEEAQIIEGCPTTLYALHPLSQKKIPIWIADYVLPHYGSGAIMAVPAHDARDYAFAKHFKLPIIAVISADKETPLPYEKKVGKMINSHFCTGLSPEEARVKIIEKLSAIQQGNPHIAYKLHDAVFSRQRYWGEPFPIYYKKGVAYPIPDHELPLRLPEIDSYKPTADGAPPLARAQNWETPEGYTLEYNTMPAWAASSWYFIRYMDPNNEEKFASPQAIQYWKQVDYYIGGAEHTTGHLIYARFFTKVLHDLGHLPFDEPFHHLINQGMLQNHSALVYRRKGSNQFVSYAYKDQYDTVPMHVDITLVKDRKLNLKAFQAWRPDLEKATFILEDGLYICGEVLEKMSKSKHNSIEPSDMIKRYGADALRLHLLFLGPIAQVKKWNSKGIEGPFRLLKKIWGLFYDQDKKYKVREEPAVEEATRALHQTIAQIADHIQSFSFNRCVSRIMILMNRLVALKVNQRIILKDIPPLIAPFAPHIAEALWQSLGNKTTVFQASFPKHNPKYLVEKEVTYLLLINGKKVAPLTLPSETSQEELIKKARSHPSIAKAIKGKNTKRIIVIPKRIINIVI